MAKANVYTYFETREALLLALLWDEWQRWFARLKKQVRSERHPRVAIDELVALLARSIAAAPLLCELTAALPTVLEQNLSEDAIRAFKRDALVLFRDVARHLADHSRALPVDGYAEFMLDTAHLIMGLYPATHPAPAAARALDDPELRFFQRDFAAELTRFMGALASDHVRRRQARAKPAASAASRRKPKLDPDRPGPVPTRHRSTTIRT